MSDTDPVYPHRYKHVGEAARKIWDTTDCSADQDCCRWTGDPKTVGRCYCQEQAWEHAVAAGRGFFPMFDDELRIANRDALVLMVLGIALGAVVMYALMTGRVG